MYVAINKKILDKIATYLSKRPYTEVFPFFDQMRTNGICSLEEALNNEKKEKSEVSDENSTAEN